MNFGLELKTIERELSGNKTPFLTKSLGRGVLFQHITVHHLIIRAHGLNDWLNDVFTLNLCVPSPTFGSGSGDRSNLVFRPIFLQHSGTLIQNCNDECST